MKKKANEQKKKGENPDPDVDTNLSPLAIAKKACKEAAKKVERAKLAIRTAGARPFELCGNLLSHKPVNLGKR